jgi:PII-like signaling protein
MDRGPAKRLVVYVSENQRWRHKPLWREVVDVCRKHGLAGATATKGIVGFGHTGRLHEDLTPDAMPDLPVTIEALDTAEAIDRALPDLDLLVEDGLIAVQDVQVIKARPRKVKPEASHVPHQKLTGKAKMLRVHTGANDTWDGEPLHLALVKRCHQLDLAGATVYRGLEGYGASGRLHRQATFRAGDEPITIVVVDVPENLEKLMPYLDEMVPGGMVVISDVEVIMYREANAAAAPPRRP